MRAVCGAQDGRSGRWVQVLQENTGLLTSSVNHRLRGETFH